MRNGPQAASDTRASNVAMPQRSSDAAAKDMERDYFLRLMLAGPRDMSASPPKTPQIDPKASGYHRLPQSRLNPKAGYHLPKRDTPPVRAESPAIEVLTDLSRVEPVEIRPGASLEEANQTMIRHGVRALFVVDDERRVLGFFTASDILGEKPMQIAQPRGLRHGEVSVQDIMIPAERIEFIDFSVVLNARVGDVVETLTHAGRQHALVVERSGDETGRQMVRGIFSLTQIARQMGSKLEISEIGHTFAEIEAALGP